MSAALMSRQNHGTHLIGGWVCPSASVDNWEKIIYNLRRYNTIRNIIDYFLFPRKRFVVFMVTPCINDINPLQSN